MTNQMTIRKRSRTAILARLMVALLVALLVAGPVWVALADWGDLDPTFDGDGRVTTDFGSDDDKGRAIAIQPDGKIVVAGDTGTGPTSGFALARYNDDGSLYPTFNTDGQVSTDFGGDEEEGWDMAIQLDGKIVVVGFTQSGDDTDFALARYNPDGSLDTTFDADGQVTTDFGSNYDWGRTVVIQLDGKIVVAGATQTSSSYDFALARYNPDGSLDTTFGTDGKVTTDFGIMSMDIGWPIALQPDGKLVVGGLARNAANNMDFALARYTPDGSLDPTFGSAGQVTTDFDGDDDEVYAIVIQPDGKIVVAGSVSVGITDDFALARYTPDGSLDTTFGTDGKVTTDVGGSFDKASGVALQTNGKIVVAGYANIVGNPNFALVRYNPDGSLDPTFGTAGQVTTDFSGGDIGYAVALQGDKIVMAGYASSGGDYNFALARYVIDDAVVVDTTTDVNDGDTSSITALKANRGADGAISLREAMLAANNTPGSNTINFNIPGAGVQTIQPTIALPVLSGGGTIIDGYSQPGATEATATTPAVLKIEIDGSNVANNNGFNISSADNVIQGLAINRFGWNGVAVGVSTATGNTIRGNHIGTDASGATDLGNGYDGVYVALGAQNNTIGGDLPAKRNVISGNGWDGVAFHGTNTMSNTVSGNYIGTAANGTDVLGNTLHGVRIYGSAYSNTVGPDNVISGNDEDGVRIFGTDTMSNTVAGNYIGTDVDGEADLGNSDHGVHIGSGAHDNTIGGDTDGERNVISGNDMHGVYIADDGVTGNMLTGNYIGTKANGAEALGNFYEGAVIAQGAQDNTVEWNVISGNVQTGIAIFGSDVANNTVANNYIGVAANGTSALGNAFGPGIAISDGAQDNTVGPNNVIAYSGMQGVMVDRVETIRNTITQNSIFSNDMLGIDLTNDAHGGIVAPLINYTTLGSVHIVGTSCPGCTVELFENSDTDGEGESYVGSTTADTSGTFTVTISALSQPYLTATATDAVSGTSEFSAVFTATVPIYDHRLFLPLIMRDSP